MSIEISTFKNQNYQNFNHTSKKSEDVILEVSLVLNITRRGKAVSRFKT